MEREELIRVLRGFAEAFRISADAYSVTGNPPAGDMCRANAREAEKLVERIEAAEDSDGLKALKEIAAGPVDEPQIDLTGDYLTGLYCGLEDRDLVDDGYSACDYGFEEGKSRVVEWAQGIAQGAIEPAPQAEALPLQKSEKIPESA